MDDWNEYDDDIPNIDECFLQPYKPFLLISKNADFSADVLSWCKTEEELLWMAANNKALHPYDAMEIGSIREIKLPIKE